MNLDISQETVRACLDQTDLVWKQSTPAEPLEHAFARLFGRPMGAAMLSMAIPLHGRLCTIHLHHGGIAAVYDPIDGGWSLRALKCQTRSDVIGNMAAAIPKTEPVPFSLVDGGRIGSGSSVSDSFSYWIRK